MEHPNREIMSELIHDQWTKDSIFAAVIDPTGNIVAKGQTSVGPDHDPTAHAEINAIRTACRTLGVSRFPYGYWLYSTFEPCPMCASAIIWAGIEGVVYANNPDYRGREDNWSFISCEKVIKAGSYLHKSEVVKDFMIDEIKAYFL